MFFNYIEILFRKMPLPPALAARLAKRGILKSPVVENGQLRSASVPLITADQFTTTADLQKYGRSVLTKRVFDENVIITAIIAL